jgi:ectoine hydroxylase-related dioxygenase (phytanoyl-CoA dioxygenase family)
MIFADSGIQKAFDANGYAILDDFFSAHDIDRLSGLLRGFDELTEAVVDGATDTINSVEKGLFLTRHFQDLRLEESIRSEMSKIANKAMQRHLSVAYKNIAALGIYKRPNSPDSVVDLHVHHSNLAPGSPQPGLSLFAPLVDLDAELGPLALIKGSHKLWENDLSYTLSYMRQAHPELYPLMESYLTTVIPMAGQAIVFDQFTIHKGLPNTHKHAGRLAITAEFIPADQDCVLFLPEFDSDGNIAKLRGRQVNKLPLEFSRNHRWVPEHLGDEVLTLDPYRARPISVDEFKACCRT